MVKSFFTGGGGGGGGVGGNSRPIPGSASAEEQECFPFKILRLYKNSINDECISVVHVMCAGSTAEYTQQNVHIHHESCTRSHFKYIQHGTEC